MSQATVTAMAKIDISPNGIQITFEGLDKDLADLMYAALSYTMSSTPVYRTFDSSDVLIKSNKVIEFVVPVVPDPTP